MLGRMTSHDMKPTRDDLVPPTIPASSPGVAIPRNAPGVYPQGFHFFTRFQ